MKNIHRVYPKAFLCDRCVSYRKTIRSDRYFLIETLFYWNFCRQNKFSSTKFLLLWWLHFLARIFNCSVSMFKRPPFFVPTRFIAATFWRCNVLSSKKKDLTVMYEIGVIFSYEVFCRNFLYRRLTCSQNGICHKQWCRTIIQKALYRKNNTRENIHLWRSHLYALFFTITFSAEPIMYSSEWFIYFLKAL